MGAFEKKFPGASIREGRCPECGRRMEESKGVNYKGRYYSFPFPLYRCPHDHGYFVQSRENKLSPANFDELIKNAEKSWEDKGPSDIIANTPKIKMQCKWCKYRWSIVPVWKNEDVICPSCDGKNPFPKT